MSGGESPRRRRCGAAVLALVVALGGAACDRVRGTVPDAALDDARGQATRAAVEVAAAGASLARGLAQRPRSTCRVPLPDGPVTVTTRVTIALKGDVQQARRYDHERTWVRDADGHVSSATRLVVPLPDGRRSVRTAELRRVGGGRWAALDGRFAAADRIPDFEPRLADEARGLVDDVLGRVARDGAAVRTARGDEGLCRPRGAFEPIDAELTGYVEIAAGRRAGALHWRDGDGADLHVVFTEDVRADAEPVAAPTEVWPVDADRGYAVTTAFVEAARASGWLGASSAEPDDTLVIDPSLSDE